MSWFEHNTAKDVDLAKAYSFSQRNRTVMHPSLSDISPACSDENFTFIIAADTQLGMANSCRDWVAEIETSRRAVAYINSLEQKPAFVSMCGDLVDMEPISFVSPTRSSEYCVEIQTQQYNDFKDVWKDVDPSIPVVCMCGNHDVGNAPTVESIERFKSQFGDDYFSFWCKGCYCICLNTNIYNDNSHMKEQYIEQHQWLVAQLEQARKGGARRIFLFGHHPWFLFDEEEDESEMLGFSPLWPTADNPVGRVPDSYFVIKRCERRKVMALCKEHKVDACFAGHYHQNNICESSWGMPMIVTGPITPIVLHSTGVDTSKLGNRTDGPGVRVVQVDNSLAHGFSHSYHLI